MYEEFHRRGRRCQDKGERICPRCGKPYSYTERHKIGNRIYLYAVHYERYERLNNKIKKKVRKCYLGPENGYEYAVKRLSKEGFLWLKDRQNAMDYLDSLIRYLQACKIDREVMLEFADRLEKIINKE